MDNIKVSVTFILPGRVLLTQDEAEHLEKEKEGNGFETTKMQVRLDLKSNKTETITVRSRKCRTATQTLNLTNEAYHYMIGREALLPYTEKSWNKLGPKAKLELHLKGICDSLGGISYSYKVFED